MPCTNQVLHRAPFLSLFDPLAACEPPATPIYTPSNPWSAWLAVTCACRGCHRWVFISTGRSLLFRTCPTGVGSTGLAVRTRVVSAVCAYGYIRMVGLARARIFWYAHCLGHIPRPARHQRPLDLVICCLASGRPCLRGNTAAVGPDHCHHPAV